MAHAAAAPVRRSARGGKGDPPLPSVQDATFAARAISSRREFGGRPTLPPHCAPRATCGDLVDENRRLGVPLGEPRGRRPAQHVAATGRPSAPTHYAGTLSVRPAPCSSPQYEGRITLCGRPCAILWPLSGRPAPPGVGGASH